MRTGLGIAVLVVGLAGVVMAADPFRVEAFLRQRDGRPVVEVAFGVPDKHHIYADTLSATRASDGAVLAVESIPPPARYQDAFSSEPRDCYTNDFTVWYSASTVGPSGLPVEVQFQGCSETLCFFPSKRAFLLGRGDGSVATNGEIRTAESADWRQRAAGVDIAGRAAGYLRVEDFITFLDASEGRQRSSQPAVGMGDRIRTLIRLFNADPVEFFRLHGVWWTILAVLLGGVLLNLTPCVLPMIPVNLAIIGVGAQGSSRMRGMTLGAVYGLGMALVYGVLGVVVVLTGASFGALNAMPSFNLAIAVLFVVLGLAMFDVITIDFSRFQGMGRAGTSLKRGSFLSALVMGGVAALLAGACVAPVVIAVLVLSGNLYAQGARTVGLALPFVLGWGMALPWPLAGGGLSRLPKPGAWMAWVKYGFGVFILIFAFYYASLAYQGWWGGATRHPDADGARHVSPERPQDWGEILAESARLGKPILVDFWATWCKNCEAMEATTFQNAEVRRRLEGYLLVKFQAEKPDAPATKVFLEYYGVKGLPTYLVLKPGGGGGDRRE
jgi:thiol:disulfide interchange protein